jgi:putative phosphoribosyl transferase
MARGTWDPWSDVYATFAGGELPVSVSVLPPRSPRLTRSRSSRSITPPPVRRSRRSPDPRHGRRWHHAEESEDLMRADGAQWKGCVWSGADAVVPGAERADAGPVVRRRNRISRPGRRFRDRGGAGRELAALLGTYADRGDVVVLGLPRGGVPVAFEVARALRSLLDVFVVRKLGVPGHEELAFGAIASGGIRVVDRDLVDSLGLPPEWIEATAARELRELERREHAYRGDRPPPQLKGRTVVLVDDGLATGSTMLAAVTALRRNEPARLVVAVPVAAPEACDALRAVTDEVTCLFTPAALQAIGVWYEDFSQTTDTEVRTLLAQTRRAI